MAVGDIITYRGAATVWNYFQPAASTEIIILSAFGQGTPFSIGIYDGADNAVIVGTSAPEERYRTTNMKIGITNTQYLSGFSQSGFIAFTGIQIK